MEAVEQRYFRKREDVTTIRVHQSPRKGRLNRDHSVARWSVVEAFHRLGGVDGMVKWGQKHRTEFYQLFSKLIPTEVKENTEGSGIKVLVYAPQSGPQPVVSLPEKADEYSVSDCSIKQ